MCSERAITPLPPPDTSGPPNFLLSFAEFRNAGDPGATFGVGWYLTLRSRTLSQSVLMTAALQTITTMTLRSPRSSLNAGQKITFRFPERCHCSPASWAVASCSADCAIVVELKQRPEALINLK